MQKIHIIGSGFSSLSAACYLAKQGFEVHVFEKNAELGGRARQLKTNGFVFDMGPSWYWMPDVFERFFGDFGKHPSDFYELEQLSPAYKVFFEDQTSLEIPSGMEGISSLFESIEAGSGVKLKKFIDEAGYNYKVAMENLVYKPGQSPLELINAQTVGKLNQFFSSVRYQVRNRFQNERLRKVLEFPVLFLGAKPQNTPAFYNIMNYADFALGTWYPKGGMHSVVEAMVALGKELGVEYHTDSAIEEIGSINGKVMSLKINGQNIASDVVLSGADYQFTESLLPSELRGYSEKYWETRTFAPSALLFFVGFNKKLKNLRHHNLFFDQDFDHHAKEIYDEPAWPKAPLFYANFPSMTDTSCAPEGKESGFFLIPLAPGLGGGDDYAMKYFDQILDRMERLSGQSLKDAVEFTHSYSVQDFIQDYNSYKGNAYGMANTLSQTAFMRPGIKSKKVKGLYFTGQLTVPGPGVPPALISGKIAAQQVSKNHKSKNYDVLVS